MADQLVIQRHWLELPQSEPEQSTTSTSTTVISGCLFAAYFIAHCFLRRRRHLAPPNDTHTAKRIDCEHLQGWIPLKNNFRPVGRSTTWRRGQNFQERWGSQLLQRPGFSACSEPLANSTPESSGQCQRQIMQPSSSCGHMENQQPRLHRSAKSKRA